MPDIVAQIRACRVRFGGKYHLAVKLTQKSSMPKAKGKNAFFFFMLDWKRRAEAKGFTFPNGLKDVQADPDCNIEWQVRFGKRIQNINSISALP